jgi:hypothetical protein
VRPGLVIVIGTPHFFSQKITKNAQKRLMTFWLGKIYELRQQVKFIWESYFSTPKVIALTILQIINDRVFPYAGRSYEEWNEIPNTVSAIIY